MRHKKKQILKPIIGAIACVGLVLAGMGLHATITEPVVVTKEIEVENPLNNVCFEELEVARGQVELSQAEIEELKKQLEEKGLELEEWKGKLAFMEKYFEKEYEELIEQRSKELYFEDKAISYFKKHLHELPSYGYAPSEIRISELGDPETEIIDWDEREGNVTFLAEITYEDEDSKLVKVFEIEIHVFKDEFDREKIEMDYSVV